MVPLARLLQRAPRARGPLLPLTWLAVGLLTAAYVVGMTVVLLLAGVVASARLLLSAPVALAGLVLRPLRSAR